ncbi:MAG: hypothetical protein KAH38_00970 [Candidatus Hydrogenedentes bacterium]|nr:hypothetical protein [Candidatus Hydrogenedentota bacterium]
MTTNHCPHCGEAGFSAKKLPREVVAIMSCQHCNELSVLFRKKIIPLDKHILESGSFDERKDHLATVIAQFLELGLLSFDPSNASSGGVMFGLPQASSLKRRKRKKESVTQDDALISDQELDRFVRVDLKCIDNPTYFKKIFGETK